MEFLKNCLIVLQPREIPECIESIKELPIDKVYFRGFNEPDLCEPINRFIREHNYDNYMILSDDVIVSKDSLALVEELLIDYEAATGYCLVAQDSGYVNITRSPLRKTCDYAPILEDYDFYYLNEVEKFKNPVFVSWFGGWCLTGFRKHLWMKNPFRVMATGRQSDYATCIVYNDILMCHKDAYVEHLREELEGTCLRNFLVGKVKPEIRYERYVHTGSYMEKKLANTASSKLLPFI